MEELLNPLREGYTLISLGQPSKASDLIDWIDLLDRLSNLPGCSEARKMLHEAVRELLEIAVCLGAGAAFKAFGLFDAADAQVRLPALTCAPGRAPHQLSLGTCDARAHRPAGRAAGGDLHDAAVAGAAGAAGLRAL